MPVLRPPTAIERIAGNPAIEVALTYTGALVGSPLAALLPVLAKALASERQRTRVEEALQAIEQILSSHAGAVRDLSDEQYKLINETVLSLLHTTNGAKFEYLQRVVQNSLLLELRHQEAVALSRIVRDISTEEILFVVQNFSCERVWLTTANNEDGARVKLVEPSSSEASVVGGLVSLGLLFSASSDYAGLGMLNWSPITAKLLAVLREPAP